MLRVGIVAGEASGDYLGAELIKQLQIHYPDLILEGIGGDKLSELGCNVLSPMEDLSVIGLVEVLGRYLKLRRVRQSLYNHFLENPPDIFIGIDAPDFNLDLELALKNKNIKTIHYVSPSVWAWRKNRIKKIKQSTDLMLTLFPFEKDIYEEHEINSVCTGHPLVEKYKEQSNKSQARQELGLDNNKIVVAILPGSRRNEISKLATTFAKTAENLQSKNKDIQFITSMLQSSGVNEFKSHTSDVEIKVFSDQMPAVLQASDAALVASGTVTLEALLSKCPMVVAYKINSLTFNIIKKMASIDYISLPNILAGRRLVSEMFAGRLQSKSTF